MYKRTFLTVIKENQAILGREQRFKFGKKYINKNTYKHIFNAHIFSLYIATAILINYYEENMY